MLRMNQIDQIKELKRQGLGSAEIAGRLNLDRKTVAKYMRADDFNGQVWIKKAVFSKLDPWKLSTGVKYSPFTRTEHSPPPPD